MDYEPTPELVSLVETKLAGHLTACFAGTPDVAEVPDGCPAEAYAYHDRSPRLDQPVAVKSLQHQQVGYQPGHAPEPSLLLTAEGVVGVTGADGKEYVQLYQAYGHIVVSPDDQLTVTFTGLL